MFDADADGRLDLVTPTALLWNRSPAGGSVRVNLAGLNSNPDGFGTRVEVKTARSRQVQEFRGGDSDPSVLHFGIGEEEEVEFVRVLWPSGVRSPGTMRIWGRHAIAFVGSRHFDDPNLFADLLVDQQPEGLINAR